jgi:hypothetical protein
MSDIALIGERAFLYEKLFADLGVSFQFLSPGILGSPFLPMFKLVMIPTGFANPQYCKTLQALRRSKSNISGFVKKGGVLTIFGPMVPEHDYDWLPMPLRYVCEIGPRCVASFDHECSCLLSTCTPECDGYLILGEGFESVLTDEKDRAILARAKYGEGLIVATTVHEFPAAEYIRWALGRANPAKL